MNISQVVRARGREREKRREQRAWSRGHRGKNVGRKAQGARREGEKEAWSMEHSVKNARRKARGARREGEIFLKAVKNANCKMKNIENSS